MQPIALRLFDVDIRIETNDPKLVQLFHQLYSEMLIAPTEVRPAVRNSRFIRTATTTMLQIGDKEWQLPAPYPKFAHNLIWYDAVQHTRSHLLLHAAGIAHNEEGTLLIGHSMSGKTTLSLALMQRGMRLLTDDVVGIDYANNELCALARQVQIRPKTHRLLNLTTTPTIHASSPYPLKNLFILSDNTPQPTHQLMLDLQAAPLAWQQQLQKHASVQNFTLATLGKGWIRCRLNLLESAARCYQAIEQLCAAHDVLIYDVQSSAARVPTFAEKPIIRPIPPSEAAFQLLPHIQNRTLATQFGGEIPLYMTILKQLQNTRCYYLQVGTPQDTSTQLFDLLSS